VDSGCIALPNTSDLTRYYSSPECVPKQAFTGHSERTGLRPRTLSCYGFFARPGICFVRNATLPPPRQPRDESGFAEPFHHIFQMRAVSRFDHDFEQRALGGQVGEGALVRDFDDVGAGFGE
jgi:hypothetical protein